MTNLDDKDEWKKKDWWCKDCRWRGSLEEFTTVAETFSRESFSSNVYKCPVCSSFKVHWLILI